LNVDTIASLGEAGKPGDSDYLIVPAFQRFSA
jgi:hypothetical protein